MAEQVNVLSVAVFDEFAARLRAGLESLAIVGSEAACALSAETDWIGGQVAEATAAEQDARAQLFTALASVSAAEATLSAAESDLSSCLASQDEDGCPSCFSEECAVSAAERDLGETRAALLEVEAALRTAQDRLETTRSWHARLEPELARVYDACLCVGCGVTAAWEGALSRLAARAAGLRAYLHVKLPDATSLESWLAGSDVTGPQGPAEIAARFRLGPDAMREFTARLAAGDDNFRTEVGRRRADLAACRGVADREHVFVQVKRTTAGLWAEKFTRAALSPFGVVGEQRRTATGGGETTVTDLVLSGAKWPLVLGRGEGRSVPAGGSLAVEVKARRPAALLTGAGRLVAQVGGHGAETASVAIVSRDVHDLGARETTFRETIRRSGSAVWALLPRKEEIDDLCWRLVTRTGEGS